MPGNSRRRALALASQTLRRHAVGALVLALCVSAAAASPAPALQTPPPTPVDGKPSPFVTRLRTPAPAPHAPSIGSPVAALADLGSGEILFSRGLDRPRPIASVTKLMTALLVLERTHLSDVVTVDRDATTAVIGFHES